MGRAIALTNTGSRTNGNGCRPTRCSGIAGHSRPFGDAGDPIIEDGGGLNNLGRQLPHARLAGGGEGRLTRGDCRRHYEWTTPGARAGTSPISEESSWAWGRRDSAIVLLSQGHTALEGASDDPDAGGGALLYLGPAGPMRSRDRARVTPRRWMPWLQRNQVRQGVGRRSATRRRGPGVVRGAGPLALTDRVGDDDTGVGRSEPRRGGACRAQPCGKQGRARSPAPADAWRGQHRAGPQ